jgi:hypothetical protein
MHNNPFLRKISVIVVCLGLNLAVLNQCKTKINTEDLKSNIFIQTLKFILSVSPEERECRRFEAVAI